jgi:menaquinone-dependent protoporphyrinogen oxidase
MKVLVAYASKYGSTKGIADFIAENIRKQGLDSDVQEVGEVRNAADYDTFVIGSAVYMFHWMKGAKQFVSRNRAVLASRPVWLFSSGPVGTQTVNSKGRNVRDASGPKEIDELRDLVKLRDHHVFFGALDGSRLTGAIALGYKMARLSKSAREEMPEGDFRDWNEIEQWTSGIVAELKTAIQGFPIPGWLVDRAGFEPATFRYLDHLLVCKPDVLRPDHLRQHTGLNYRPTRLNPIFYPG